MLSPYTIQRNDFNVSIKILHSSTAALEHGSLHGKISRDQANPNLAVGPVGSPFCCPQSITMVTHAVSMSCSCTFAPQAPHVLVPPAYSPAVGVAIGKLA